MLATMMAGAMMMAVGFFQLGTYIKYIPYPVTIGFTAGIAVIIFASQVKDLLGLDIVKEPSALVPKIAAIWGALGTIKPVTVALSILAIAIILGLRAYRPKWPGLLIAVVVSAALTAIFHLDVATIGSRFGGIPNSLPLPVLPEINLAKMRAVLPDAISIALLGAIESLLSAVVADGMTGRKHRSNCELVGQGVANIGAVIFGGMCVTGTIARTATNVRSGAHGPVSGILHSFYILVFMLIAAPLASFVPLACLGGILAVISWNMAERHEFAGLLRTSWGDAAVLMATFLLTIFEDLIVAIAVGVTLGAFLFLHRMAEAVEIQGGGHMLAEDEADATSDARLASRPAGIVGDALVYRIRGAFFFGATAAVSNVLDQIGARPKVFILDMTEVPLVDTTAARMLGEFVEKLSRSGTKVYLCGARSTVRRTLLNAGLRKPAVRYAATSADALQAARNGRVQADASRPVPPVELTAT